MNTVITYTLPPFHQQLQIALYEIYNNIYIVLHHFIFYCILVSKFRDWIAVEDVFSVRLCAAGAA